MSVFGQSKMGLPQQLADSAAILDLSSTGATASTYRGLLLPQVALSSTTTWGMFQPTVGTAARNGLMVYNTVSAGAGATLVSPGIYYWYNGQWIALTLANPTNAAYCSSASANFQIAPSTGSLFPGTNYTATYSLPYGPGTGASYTAVSTTSNGLTLTRVAGTYSTGGGNVVYNLTGTYTGAAGGTAVFTIAECSNSSTTTATFGTFTSTPDYIRQGLNSSAAAYDATAAGNWVQVTAAEYNNAQTTVTSTIVAGETNSVLNATPTSNYGTGAVSSPSCSMSANAYLYGFSFMTSSIAPASTSSTMISVGISSVSAASNGVFNNFPAGASIPGINSMTTNTRYYFLLKKPASASGSTTYYCGFYIGGMLGAFGSAAAPVYYYAGLNGNIPGSTQSGAWTTAGANAYYAPQQFLGTTNKQW